MRLAGAALLIGLVGASCTDETAVHLRVRFPDCSIDPAAIGALVFVIQPADDSPIAGLGAGTQMIDGVAVSGDDVDGDGVLEWVLRLSRAGSDIHDRTVLSIVRHGTYADELTVDVLAADDDARQLGALGGEPVHFRFVDGEVRTVDLPVTCLCLGMQGCGGTCEGAGVDPDCRPEGDHERYCHDGLDNDADPLRDCADPECYRRGPCAACDVEVCDNDLDDDCDSDIDCGDDACSARPLCQAVGPEICDNGGDDDRDHLRDCLDPDCEDFELCSETCTPSPELCQGQRDEDCDRRIDCFDDECSRPDGETACDDGFDDDCDDRVDCADPDCYESPGCECDRVATEERRVMPDGCHDGLDDDCDGRFDCEDDDCDGAIAEVCDDTIDNDCDGLNNCDDDDCPGETAAEVCDDLFDNDCDGLFDCEDPACHDGPAIERPDDCADFLDNDCDEAFDCDDPDCSESQLCRGTVP